MSAPVESVQSDKPSNVTYLIKGRDYPFYPVKEFVYKPTGQFITISRVTVVHVKTAFQYEGVEGMMKLIQMCAKIDDQKITDIGIHEMEVKLFTAIREELEKQIIA